MEHNKQMPAVALGTWSWGTGAVGGDQVFGNHLSAEDLKPVFDAAMEQGLNLWDTAVVYGMGASEDILGAFAKASPREQIDRSPAAVTYPPEADCGHFRDAAVFPRHPGGDRLHPGRHETAGHPGICPAGVYGNAPDGVRHRDGGGVVCGGGNPGHRKPCPQNQRRIPAHACCGLHWHAGSFHLAGALICGTIRGERT